MHSVSVQQSLVENIAKIWCVEVNQAVVHVRTVVSGRIMSASVTHGTEENAVRRKLAQTSG
jgi:hypothetical protein